MNLRVSTAGTRLKTSIAIGNAIKYCAMSDETKELSEGLRTPFGTNKPISSPIKIVAIIQTNRNKHSDIPTSP
ncbi:hypothetical protein GAVG_0172 [Gardnerella vaginalis ATCC 14018 = JCM 11026]|nr:hypothetical protein GAVG_0172 [Gardnerella vaginalis ATCC 14018 = JCM 11026]